MGGNTYNRQCLSDTEIEFLVDQALADPEKSIRTGKSIPCRLKWRADVSRLLDSESCRKFYYLLEIKSTDKPKTCGGCDRTLSIESFRSLRGFRKYCPNCMLDEVWKHKSHLNPGRLQERGRRISETKLRYYQTDSGQATAAQTGKKNSVKLKSFYQSDSGRQSAKRAGQKSSVTMKKKILAGSFTPGSNNRNTHWESTFQGKKYRSSWEALYQFHYPAAKYEHLRIPYTYLGKEHVYIVDFIDYDRKTVCEVKPRELMHDERTRCKLWALHSWATEQKFTLDIFDQSAILELPEPDYQMFDEHTQRKLRKYYEKTKN